MADGLPRLVRQFMAGHAPIACLNFLGEDKAAIRRTERQTPIKGQELQSLVPLLHDISQIIPLQTGLAGPLLSPIMYCYGGVRQNCFTDESPL